MGGADKKIHIENHRFALQGWLNYDPNIPNYFVDSFICILFIFYNSILKSKNIEYVEMQICVLTFRRALSILMVSLPPSTIMASLKNDMHNVQFNQCTIDV